MVRVFKHYFPKLYLFLGVFECLVFVVSIYIGAILRMRTLGAEGTEYLPYTALLYAIVMMVSMLAMGLYQRQFFVGASGLLVRIFGAFFVGATAMSLVFYVQPLLFLGRGAFGLSMLASLIGVLGLRVFLVRFVDAQMFKRRVVVLGAGKQAKTIAQVDTDNNYRIIDFIQYQHEPALVECIQLDQPLVSYVIKNDIDEVVVAVDDRRGLPVDELLDCKMSGFDVIEVSSFFEKETYKIQLDTVHPSWLMFSDGFSVNHLATLVKRLFDLLASSLVFLIAWPFIVLTALAVWMEGRFKEPILYSQHRVGQNWKLFKVYKFRSMRVDAEKNGAQWAQQNDPRVTKVGAFIRKTRLDEFPQLWNVLKGDMSFVGPRPERPEFVEDLAKNIPYYSERHRVKPGITGWAQMCYAYGSSQEDAIQKLQYDLYYVKNYSLFLDLIILIQTAEIILWGKGAR